MLRDTDLADVLSMFVALASDETPMTRRAAAKALAAVADKLADHAGHALSQVSQRFKPQVYPLLQALSVDARDHLRELAPQVLAAITPLIPAADFFHLVLPLINGLRDDHSWRVRAALATALPAIAHGLLALAQTHVQQKAANALYQGGHFELGGLIRSLFEAHVAMLRDPAEEVRAMAVLGLANMVRASYGVALLVPARPRFTIDVTAQDSFDFSDTHLEPAAPKHTPAPLAGFAFPGATVFDRLADALAALARDQSSILKQDLCDQVGALAPLVGRDLTQAHLVPVLQTLMHDQSADVLASVAENLEAPAETLGAQALATSILPILTTLLKDPRWRIHRAVAANLGMLARLLSKGKVFETRVVPMVKSLLTQHCHAVRNRACVELRVITYELGVDVVLEKLFPAAAELYDAKINYLHRLTALHFCLYTATAQQQACPAQVIVDHFCPIFIQGLRDPVPNVRILAAQSVATLIPRLDRAYVQSQLLPLLEELSRDADKEVALQAALAMDVAAQR
jgi:serine/threonine-protein phosphatase 2A regulatory subunit A